VKQYTRSLDFLLSFIIPAAFFFVFFGVLNNNASGQSLQMNIRYPVHNDTLARSKTRLAATVSDTNAIVTLNGDTLRVYSSGVFVSLLKLDPGWNTFLFKAENSVEVLIDTIAVFRPEPVKSLSKVPTQFASDFVLPQGNSVYFDRDVIVVQFRGSPGGEASFEIDDLLDDPLPMEELAPGNRTNLAGIYRGMYRIQPADQCEKEPVTFYLTGKDGDEMEWETERYITVDMTGQDYIVSTTCDNNLVYYQPGGEIFLELPAGIRLTKIADHGRWQKVRIAENITGYISSRCIENIGRGDILPYARYTGCSSKIENDWLVFNLRISDQVPFKLIQKSDPQVIELTFYRSTVAGEWSVLPVNDHVSHPDSSFFRYFEWKQISDDELRFRFYLNTNQQWGYKGWYEDQLFKLALRKPPIISADSLFENLIIALDAGHGGAHSGAVGATGYEEKEANLIYTKYLENMLTDAGARVIMTRMVDTTMSLKSRADTARLHNAHILVWMHNNSIGRTSDPEKVKGTSTYYTHLQGMPFALYVYPEMVNLGLEPFGRIHRTYYITRQTDFVVFLVEGAFLSNPEDEIFLMNEQNLKKLAQAVFDGMKEYLITIADR
jgi:N-acetylmuramoyl-L-alanine amidase